MHFPVFTLLVNQEHKKSFQNSAWASKFDTLLLTLVIFGRCHFEHEI